MATKRVANNVLLKMDRDKDATYETIASIRRIGSPGKSREAIDVTCLASTIDEMKPAPQLTNGDCTFTLFWDEADTDHLQFETAIDDATEAIPFQIEFPYSPTITKSFQGWIKELGEISHEVKGEITRDCVIHVTTTPSNS